MPRKTKTTHDSSNQIYSVATRNGTKIHKLENIHQALESHLESQNPTKTSIPDNFSDYLKRYRLQHAQPELLEAVKKRKKEASWIPVVDPKIVLKRIDNIRDAGVIRKGKKPNRTLVLGQPGYGRGAIVQSLQVFFPLVQRIRADVAIESYKSTLFITTSVSQEFSSVVLAITEWLKRSIKERLGIELKQPEPSKGNDARIVHLKQLVEAAATIKLLLVFSNVERLFRDQQPLNPLIDQMYKVLFRNQSALDIIILTQPGQGDDYFLTQLGKNRPNQFILPPPKLEHSAVLSKDKHKSVLKKHKRDLQSVFEAVNSHTYCIEILCTQLAERNCSKGELRRIASVSTTMDAGPALSFVTSEVIRMELSRRKTERGKTDRSVVASLLKHLALIGQPVSKRVLKKCLQLALGPRSKLSKRIESGLINLTDSGLVMPIEAGTQPHTKFALHRLVRRTILASMTSISRVEGEFTFFSASLYGVQPEDAPTLDRATYTDLLRLLKHLTNSAKSKDSALNADYLMAAQAIVENFFSVAVLSRIQELPGEMQRSKTGARLFDDHADTLRSLYDLARPRKKPSTSSNAVYYDHELIWLLNERGVTFLAQGNLIDAIPCFRKAIRESEGQYIRYWIKTNYALACIQRARFGRARRLLNSIIVQSGVPETGAGGKDYYDVNPYWLARGWEALLCHIEGKYRDSAEKYEAVIAGLTKLGRPRGLAVFRKHYADLLRITLRPQKARRQLVLAIAAAERSGSMDLLHHARISEARLKLNSESPDLRAIDLAMEHTARFAETTGLDQIAVDAALVRSSIAHKRGRLVQASEMALKASALATQNGMKLRELSAQLLLANVRLDLSDSESAQKIAKMVNDQCQHYSYQVGLDRAQELLIKIR